MTFHKFAERLRSRFNLMPDKDDEQEIISQINSGVSFTGANLWVLIFAIFIASLGLNINSTAVIIGAMLISPLMGPIIGMGLSVGINDLDLLRRSFKNFGVATFISVLTATLYFLITPLNEARSELLARTSPTLYDVLIAFCGGAAGIIALCTRGKGNVIPGVAIATALMPPLCTAGYGLATGHILYFLGAFYLFFINTVFIALATYCGVRMMHFSRNEFPSAEYTMKARRILTAVVVVTMIPAAFLTVRIVRQSIFDNNVQKFIRTELSQRGTQIISDRVDSDSLKLSIVAVGREISPQTIATAESKMHFYDMDGYQLHVIQGTQSDSLLMLNDRLVSITNSRESEHHKLLELTSANMLLNKELAGYQRYETIAAEIRPELATLFPQISTFALSRVVEYSRDSTDSQFFTAAIIHCDKAASLTSTEDSKLHDWLQARLNADTLVVIKK